MTKEQFLQLFRTFESTDSIFTKNEIKCQIERFCYEFLNNINSLYKLFELDPLYEDFNNKHNIVLSSFDEDVILLDQCHNEGIHSVLIRFSDILEYFSPNWEENLRIKLFSLGKSKQARKIQNLKNNLIGLEKKFQDYLNIFTKYNK